MILKEGKHPEAVELPICPFCDGKVHYTTWTTHKIYQMECTRCKAHWRTGLKDTPQRDMYVMLTQPTSNSQGIELLGQKHPLTFWQDMVTKRIRI